MSAALAAAAAEVLAQEGEVSLDGLLRGLRAAGGRGVSRAALERVLSGDPRFVCVEVLGRERWRLREAAGADGGGDPAAPTGDPAAPTGDPAARTATTQQTRAALEVLELRTWQAEALAAWSATGQGVVEAVTGAGKTRLALAASRIVLDRGGRVLVLVPTLELLDQWRRSVREYLPGVSVGRLGGGGQDDLFSHRVLLATPHSAAGVPLDLPPGTPGLVIADEAHRYGSPTWADALPGALPLRLALTATYERGDEGIEEVLEPYFGPVVLRYRYDRAVREGTVAPFSIALAAVDLEDSEQASYTAADRRVRTLHKELVGGLGMPREPRALLRAVAAVVAEADAGGTGGGTAGGTGGRQARACREYLAVVRLRREIAATSASKLAVLTSAAPALAGGRSLVFTDTVQQAEAAAATLSRAGVAAETVHGELATDRRRIRLAQFRRGRIAALVAPRVLDEGIDVPDADVAVVLAAFRTRRQLVQRLGRILRRKEDGRVARLVLAHARGTAEDPDRGGHADFLAEVRGVARAIDRLDVVAEPTCVSRWLSR